MRLNLTANSSVFGRKNRENAPIPFYEACTGKTSKIRLNFTANCFVFGRKNAPRKHVVNLECGELSKCVWTSQQTALFLDALIMNMRPEPFLQNLQAKNFQNAYELHCKQLRFRTHKSWKCAQKFFCEHYKRKTFKMRLNSRQTAPFLDEKIVIMCQELSS